jgi:hypothetical protein
VFTGLVSGSRVWKKPDILKFLQAGKFSEKMFNTVSFFSAATRR